MGAFVLGARSTSSSDRFRIPMGIKERKNYISTYDLQYYVTSGHYAMLSVQRLHDVFAGEQHATLIWQGDYILTPLLETPRGETRGQIANRLLPEIKARVESFRDQVQWTTTR